MIVLLLSAGEAQHLLAWKDMDRGLRDYLARELQMEQLLPDNNLPESVELRQIGLSEDRRHYEAVTRTYGTVAQADQAWALKEAV